MKMKNESSPLTFTASRVMFYVALEQYQPDKHRLLQDDLARQMLPGCLKLLVGILGFKPLRQAFLNLVERNSPGMRCGIFSRKRYIDEKLTEIVEKGIDSVVILGSGLDTRAYRIPQLSTLSVYEVDLPQTIAFKERRLQQLYGSVPPHVRLVPIDFDRQKIEDVLTSHGYSLGQRSFFIWEGVTQYISEPAVRAVFGFLFKASLGSRILFTYIVKDFLEGDRTYGLEKMYRQTRVKSHLWQFGLQPSQVPAFIGEYAWKEIEQVGADEYRQRYLKPVGRTDAVMEIERMVCAEKVAR
jgi:methyltransferase (TIGR00027 family)